VGAAAISGILDDIEDPALKATMERLRNVIKPGEENRRRLLEERLGRESIDLSTERMRLTRSGPDARHQRRDHPHRGGGQRLSET
jgi:hypothetical protein